MKIDAIMLSSMDNVATALRDLAAGESAIVSQDDLTHKIKIKERIAYGHKFALVNIAKGEDILKYGERIGRATQEIESGSHAHVHNVESLRGRGDLN